VNYLLDTNVLSELRKGEKVNPNVRTWYETVPAESLYLSVLTLGEVRIGIERCRRRDPAAAVSLENWLLNTERYYSSRILSVDQHCADLWGRLNSPNPVSCIDGLLAATALANQMTLVTRNVQDIDKTGVLFINPFSE